MPLRNLYWRLLLASLSETVVAELPLIVVAPPSTATLLSWLSSAHQVAATRRVVLTAPFPSPLTRRRW